MPGDDAVRTLFLLCAAAHLIACASAPAPSQPPCNSVDKPCPTGQACFEDGCGNALEFAVRVAPNSPAYVVQDFNPVSVATSVVDIALGDPGHITGSLQIWRAGEAAAYFASMSDATTAFGILARGRSSSIPNLAFDDPVGTTVRSGASYQLTVPPGVWTVRATPANLDIPTSFAEVTVASGSSVDPGLILPGESEADLLKIAGTLQRAPANPWPAEGGPLYRFQALDPATGTSLSQPVTFRAGSPFKVWARKAVGKIALRATPAPSETAPLPSRDFMSDSNGEFPAFELGDFGEPFLVQGKVEDGAGNAIAAARVEISGAVQGGLGSLTATANTGSDGTFAVWLLKSDPTQAGYRITARPPFDSAFATGTALAKVLASGPLEVSILCPKKALLSGTVTLADGSAAADVALLIEGNPASSAPGASVITWLRTDASGAFTAPVEPGGYRVVAMPSASRKLPWGSRRVQVDGATSVALALSDPREVAGTVAARAGGTATPLPNASVVFYRSDTSSPSEHSYPIKLYETITDAQGQFRVYLPKSGAAE